LTSQTTITVYHNNKEVRKVSKAGASANITKQLRLLPGDNRIKITVRDTEGRAGERVVNVHYEPVLPKNRRFVYLGCSKTEMIDRTLYGALVVEKLWEAASAQDRNRSYKLTGDALTSREAGINLRQEIGKAAADDVVLVVYSGYAEPVTATRDLLLSTADSEKGNMVRGVLVSMLVRYLPNETNSIVLVVITDRSLDDSIATIAQSLTRDRPRMSILYVYAADYSALLKDIDTDKDGLISVKELIQKAGDWNAMLFGKLPEETNLFRAPMK